MLASLLFIASAAATTTPRIENAVTIHTVTRDYLEFDIAPIAPCMHPTVHGFSLLRSRTVVVDWQPAMSKVDTNCQEKVGRANVLLPFPDSVGGVHGDVILDTVASARTSEVVTNIGRVTPGQFLMCPMIACRIPDSATAFQSVRARIESSSFVATFAPYHVASLVPTSPWSGTDGSQNYPDVVVPLPGNAGNWIDVDRVQLRMDSLVAGRLTSPCSTGVVCPLYVVLPNVSLPTGPVQYFYQQATDPFNGDTSGTIDSFVQDTVLKIGSRLHLSGYVKHTCGQPTVDSQLIKETLWLVASGGSLPDSLAAAFQLPAYCTNSRPGAWPIRGGNVEITQGVWVPMRDLMDVTGIGHAPVRVAGPSLRRVGQAANLELPAPALVRAIDLSGREIMPSTAFSAGPHALRLPGHGMLFVQVRSGLSTVTFPLEPIH